MLTDSKADVDRYFNGLLGDASHFLRVFAALQEYHSTMQVATGTVINGKIVLEGVPLPEGAVVTVVTRGADEGFVLTAEQENELLASMAEIERGEFVTLEALLASLSQ